jgi:hypothetical protein
LNRRVHEDYLSLVNGAPEQVETVPMTAAIIARGLSQ